MKNYHTKFLIALVAGSVMLGACGQRFERINVDGVSYPTSWFEGRKGKSPRKVHIGSKSYPCQPDSKEGCAAVVRQINSATTEPSTQKALVDFTDAIRSDQNENDRHHDPYHSDPYYSYEGQQAVPYQSDPYYNGHSSSGS